MSEISDEFKPKPPILVRNAWVNNPDAETGKSACASEKANEAWAEYYNRHLVLSVLKGVFNPRSSVIAEMTKFVNRGAEFVLQGLTEDEKSDLSPAKRAAYTRLLENSESGNRAAIELLKSGTSSQLMGRGFLAWNAEKMATFLTVLDRDPIIEAANSNWSLMTKEQRIQLAEHVQRLQADVFGFKPVPIEAEDTPPEEVDGKFSQNWGSYSQGKITLNFNEDEKFPMLFSSFLDTVAHESTHAFQDQFLDRFIKIYRVERDVLNEIGKASFLDLSDNQKKILHDRVKEGIQGETIWDSGLMAGGGFVQAGSSFASRYIPSSAPGSSHESYRLNPEEQHAFDVGDYVGNFLEADREGRIRQIKEIKELGNLYGSIHQLNGQIREQSLKRQDLCPAP